MLFALAAKWGLDIHHVDVKTAFLNGNLEEDIFMKQPEEFVLKGTENKVCKLNKAIYGLKQASRSWNKNVDGVLKGLDYKKCDSDTCVYFKRNGSKIVIIGLYVDDFLIFFNDNEEVERLKNTLNEEYKIKDLGEANKCLEIRIRRKGKNEIYLDQEQFIDEILERFNMQESKAVSTPIDVNQKFEEFEEITGKPYQNLIGSLMYLAVLTRPDISHVVSKLSQFNTKYGEAHWKAAKRVLRYLKGTKDYCLAFKKNDDDLIGFSDADWGGESSDRRSYTGFVFTFSGGAVSWESRKQISVALSTVEAEYMAIAESAKEGLHLRRLLKELGDIEGPVTIYNDNQGAQKLSSNPVNHRKTKHIDIRYHFIRDLVEKKEVNVKYLRTEHMVADFLTKGLNCKKHEFCSNNVGLTIF